MEGSLVGITGLRAGLRGPGRLVLSKNSVTAFTGINTLTDQYPHIDIRALNAIR
jgi:hypothetical protein